MVPGNRPEDAEYERLMEGPIGDAIYDYAVATTLDGVQTSEEEMAKLIRDNIKPVEYEDDVDNQIDDHLEEQYELRTELGDE